ncbi:MAG: hypothetical protein AABY33_08565 [Pseudomonadota bacterium]
MTTDIANPQPTQITIYAQPERSLSPYQQRMEKPFELVNDDFFGEGGLSFKSVLDSINPLQQVPGLSTLYREVTGDTISTGSRLVGGALIGGPIGFAIALFNEIVGGVTGKDIGGNLLAAVSDKYSATDKLI